MDLSPRARDSHEEVLYGSSASVQIGPPSLLGIPASQTGKKQEVSKTRCLLSYHPAVAKTGHDHKSGVLARSPFKTAISGFNGMVERKVFTNAGPLPKQQLI